jgi:hypothetical protein
MMLTLGSRRLAAAAVAFAAAASAACGTTGTTAGAPGAQAAPATPASFLYRPFEARYRVASQNHTEQEFGGQVNAYDLALAYFVTAAATEAGDALHVSFTLDSVVSGSPLPPGVSAADFQSAVGATFSGTLSPTGEISDFQASEGTGQFLQQLTTSLPRFFARVPSGGAHPGQTWSDSSEVSAPSGGLDMQITTTTDYSASQWGMHDGVEALDVTAVSRYTISGGGVQGGAEITVDGTGTSHARLVLGADGRMLGQTSADTANFTATVIAMGAIIPVTQIRFDTVSVVR